MSSSGVDIACRRMDFSSFPEALVGENTRYLFLEYNRISRLEPFMLASLGTPAAIVTLQLTFNEITFIGENAFLHLPDLEAIFLGHNQLTELLPGAFNHCPKLLSLSLINNELTTLPVFPTLPRAEQLFLDANPLQFIPGESLAGLSGMTFFSAAGVRWGPSGPNVDLLLRLGNLSTVNFNRNNLTSFPDSFFFYCRESLVAVNLEVCVCVSAVFVRRSVFSILGRHC